jgi:hypothetical protein
VPELPKHLEAEMKKSKPRKKRARKCPPEQDVRKKIKASVLEEFPSCWHFAPVQTMRGKHGIPDDLFCIPVEITEEMVGKTYGVFVALEAKADDGLLKPVQAEQIEQIRKAGGIAGVVRGLGMVPKMIESLKRKLK